MTAQPAATGPITGLGTSEDVWRPWLAAQPWPELDIARLTRGGRGAVVAVAAHPDDEVLGIGGLLSRLAAAGAHVRVLWATDGEGSHPGSTVLAPAELARIRRAESLRALSVLGVPHDATRLGLPDSGVAAFRSELADALAPVVGPDDLVLAPWRGDAHPDHEACGHAAAQVAGAAGARLLEYPVWAWHWAAPGDPRLPWGDAWRSPLDAGTQARKAEAVAAFVTQVEPLGTAPADAAILAPHVLARFARPYELVFG